MILAIRIVGKARQVFARIEMMAEKAGELTIGELARIAQMKKSGR